MPQPTALVCAQHQQANRPTCLGLLDGKTIRVTIGSPATWSISQAQTKARDTGLIDEGQDPRQVKRQAAAEREQQAAAQAQERAQSLIVCEAWHTYLQERRAHWGERHYQDHVVLALVASLPSAAPVGVA